MHSGHNRVTRVSVIKKRRALTLWKRHWLEIHRLAVRPRPWFIAHARAVRHGAV